MVRAAAGAAGSTVDPILKMQKVDQNLSIYRAVFFQGYKKGWPKLRSTRK